MCRYEGNLSLGVMVCMCCCRDVKVVGSCIKEVVGLFAFALAR